MIIKYLIFYLFRISDFVNEINKEYINLFSIIGENSIIFNDLSDVNNSWKVKFFIKEISINEENID